MERVRAICANFPQSILFEIALCVANGEQQGVFGGNAHGGEGLALIDIDIAIGDGASRCIGCDHAGTGKGVRARARPGTSSGTLTGIQGFAIEAAVEIPAERGGKSMKGAHLPGYCSGQVTFTGKPKNVP